MSPILTASSLADMANRQQTEAIRTYMKENFGYPGMETSWYASIVSLSVEGKSVVVTTKLSKTTTAEEFAKGICQAVSGYIFSPQHRSMGIEHIQVLGPAGIVVVSRRGLDDRCEIR